MNSVQLTTFKRSSCALLFAGFCLLLLAPMGAQAKPADYFPPPDAQGGWRTLKDAAAIRKLAGMEVHFNPDLEAKLSRMAVAQPKRWYRKRWSGCWVMTNGFCERLRRAWPLRIGANLLSTATSAK